MKYQHIDPTLLPAMPKLIRSTFIAIIVAIVLVVTVILPAEYGIDPTRVGSFLGLTHMGEIKMKLAQEAKKATAAEAEKAEANAAISKNVVAATSSVADTVVQNNVPSKTDQMIVMLAPDATTEIKLEMKKGMEVKYTWQAEGGSLNWDMHADHMVWNSSDPYRYSKGLNETSQSSSFIAPFDGKHGWFWRNRSGKTVTLTVKVEGSFLSLKELK